jgi:hypothetical protein
MAVARPTGEAVRSYSTRFQAAEDPISEGGIWLLGRTHGVDWADVRTKVGHAYGETIPLKVAERPAGGGDPSKVLEVDEELARITGAHTPELFIGDCTDPTAILAGPWGRNQYARCRVVCTKPNEKYFHEVQLRLRFTVHPKLITGYELMFRVLKSDRAYAEICRWNGRVTDWTSLHRNVGLDCGVGDGDIIEATMIGNVVKGFVNGKEVLSATDDTFPVGSPGFGFNFGNMDTYIDYGISYFEADTYDD